MSDKLNNEINAWFELINEYLQQPHYNIFVKGGSVLGLEVLRLMKNSTLDKFNEHLNLNLVRDFDFSLYVPDEHTKQVATSMAEARNFRLEGETIYVVRYKDNLKIGPKNSQEALFEMSIKQGSHPFDKPLELEMPMTAMSIQLDEKNIYFFFEIAKIYYKIMELKIEPVQEDVDNVHKNMDGIKILVPNSVNGFQIVEHVDYGTFVEEIKVMISKVVEDQYPDQDQKQNHICLAAAQFIATQIEQPDRLFLRLISKNIPKTIKISAFLQKYGISVNWLVDTLKTHILITNFIDELSVKIQEIFDNGWGLVNSNYTTYIDATTQMNTLKSQNQKIPKQLGRQSSQTYEKLKFSTNEIFTRIDRLFTGMNIGRVAGLIPQYRFTKVDMSAFPLLKKMVPVPKMEPFLDNKFYDKHIKKNAADGNKYLQLIYSIFLWEKTFS